MGFKFTIKRTEDSDYDEDIEGGLVHCAMSNSGDDGTGCGIHAVDGWMPIESAPMKWGQYILLYCPGLVPFVGHYHDSGLFWLAETDHLEVSCGGYCYGGSIAASEAYKPTHWLPLPNLPSREGQENGEK